MKAKKPKMAKKPSMKTEEEDEGLRVISYGGGVQSTALLVLSAAGRLGRVDAALFANVGEKSENPATLAYFRDHAQPFAAAHGVNLIEMTNRVDLYDHVLSEGNRSIAIPVRMEGGGFGQRKCTDRWKVARVAAWTRAHGATAERPATVLVGFSADEWHRISNRRRNRHEVTAYPLVDMRIDRAGCAAIIRRAGLPVPPKSSCWFCPFQKPSRWAETRRDAPEVFEAGVAFEDAVNVKRARIGKDSVTLAGVSLREVHEADPSLFPSDEGCNSGYCFL